MAHRLTAVGDIRGDAEILAWMIRVCFDLGFYGEMFRVSCPPSKEKLPGRAWLGVVMRVGARRATRYQIVFRVSSALRRILG